MKKNCSPVVQYFANLIHIETLEKIILCEHCETELLTDMLSKIEKKSYSYSEIYASLQLSGPTTLAVLVLK